METQKKISSNRNSWFLASRLDIDSRPATEEDGFVFLVTSYATRRVFSPNGKFPAPSLSVQARKLTGPLFVKAEGTRLELATP